MDLNSIHVIENDPLEMKLLPAIGDYHVLALGPEYPIAISTLSNIELADQLAELPLGGVCIIGKTETENIGIEKIIQNVLATPSITYLVLCGKDSEGHFSGHTMRALAANGVDDKMRVIGSKGKKPVLANLTMEEVQAFRNQINVIDLIDCEDLSRILDKVHELQELRTTAHDAAVLVPTEAGYPAGDKTEIVRAGEKDPNKVTLDIAGYFVIVPKPERNLILVEHYSNKNKLLRIIQGTDARNIYWTIIENGWVTEMSHAAYLGKELTMAEISMKSGFKYIQDKA